MSGGERERSKSIKTTTWRWGAVMSAYNEDETMTLSLDADLAKVRLHPNQTSVR